MKNIVLFSMVAAATFTLSACATDKPSSNYPPQSNAISATGQPAPPAKNIAAKVPQKAAAGASPDFNIKGSIPLTPSVVNAFKEIAHASQTSRYQDAKSRLVVHQTQIAFDHSQINMFYNLLP